MSQSPGQYRVVLPEYHYTTVPPIYPAPAMHDAAVLNDYDLAVIMGGAVALVYGRAYLLDAHRHHVLRAWTLVPDGVEESESPSRHLGVGLGDTTTELTSLGGRCNECRSPLDSLPEPRDPRSGVWPVRGA